MNIGEVVKGIFTFLFQDATDTYVKPFFELMKFVCLSPETLAKMSFIENMIGVTRAIGGAFLILVVGWQALKSMFGMFIETDEPLKIAVKTFIAAFLLFYIDQLLLYFISVGSEMIKLIMQNQSWNEIDFFDLFTLIYGNGGINTLLMIFLFFKCIGFFYRTFQRLAMSAVLILCSPLAVAAMVAKPTEGFWQGFVKLCAGNILIQLLQAICYVAMLACFFQIRDNLNVFDSAFYIILTISLLSVANKLEDIVRDLSISVGIGRDMQGAMGKLQGAAYTTMTVQSVAGRFVKK